MTKPRWEFALSSIGAALIGVAVATDWKLLLPLVVLAVLAACIILPLASPGRAMIAFCLLLSVYYFIVAVLRDRFGVSEVALSVLSRWQVIGLAMLALAGYRRRRRVAWSWNSLDVCIAAYGAIVALALLAAPDLVAGVFAANTLLQFVAAYVAGRFARAEVVAAAPWLVKGIVVLAVFGILQPVLWGPSFYISVEGALPTGYLQETGSGLPRASSIVGSPGYFGSLLFVSIAILTGVGLAGRRHRMGSRWGSRSIVAASAIVCIIALVASFHRTSWLATVIAVAFVAASASRRSAWPIIITMLVAVPIVLIANSTFGAADVVWRAVTLQDFSAASHYNRAGSYLDLALAHPLGVGLGAVGNTAAFFGNPDAVGIEGGYSQVVLQLGWCGLAAYLAVHIAAIARLLARSRLGSDIIGGLAIGCAGALVGEFAFDFALPFQSFNPALMVLWLYVGASVDVRPAEVPDVQRGVPRQIAA